MKMSAKVLLAVAALMVLRNISAAFQELHSWHGITATFDPAFLAQIINNLLPTVTAFVAGLGLDLPAGMTPVYAGPDRRGDQATGAVMSGAGVVTAIAVGPVTPAPEEAPHP